MRRLLKGTGVLVVALATSAVALPSAQAAFFEPESTAVSGTASNPTITYGIATIKCNTGGVTGKTPPKSTGFNYFLLTPTLSGNCNINGLAMTPTCLNKLHFEATDAKTTSGAIHLNATFECHFEVAGVCTVHVVGPQVTSNSVTLNETANTLTATLTVDATRSGSSLCGPASGVAAWTASYSVTPPDFRISS